MAGSDDDKIRRRGYTLSCFSHH